MQFISGKPNWFSKTKIIILAGLALIVAIHIALPPFILRFANRKLNEIPEYRGHIDGVDLRLFRGAYQIKGVRLEKLNGEIPIPFFSASLVDISVEWAALFRGKWVGEVKVFQPKVNFITAPTKEKSQTGIDDSWTDKVKNMSPLRINHFIIRDGEIHFRDLHQQPNFDIHLDHLQMDASGLTNENIIGKPLPALVHVEGRAMDQAQLRLDIKLAPLEKQPTFNMKFELVGLKLATLNDFLRAYADVEAGDGRIDLFTEIAASEGRFKGYVKPLMKDVKIVNLKKGETNPMQILWEGLVAGAAKVFENPSSKRVGAQIPLSGTFSDPKIGIWGTIGSLLRNAFVRALKPQLNNSVSLEKIMK